MGDYPRATEQLTRAVAEMRKGDEKELTHVYESKAIYEHGVAMLQEMREHKDSAKAAYQRALEEDVSYWPAHRQLGQLLLATGDTAGAITELEQAVQLKEDDAGLRYQYGWALTMGNRAEDAVAQFKKAVELDPDYAAPYFLLGRIYDLAEMSSDAQTWYKGYIARAPAADRQLSMAKQRLVALLAADAAASSKPAKP